MKKTRIAKMLTAATLSAAMVMSMGGMTAFAASKEVSFKKNFTVSADATIPTVTFSYTIVGVDDKNEGEDVNRGVNADLIEIDDVTYNADSSRSDLTDKKVTVSIPDTVFANAQPGVYRYKITETTTSADFSADIALGEDESTTKYLDVYVKNVNGTKEIYEFKMFDALTDKTTNAKDEDFTSVYNTYSLTLTKHVSGDMGETDKFFYFDLNFEGPDGYKLNYTENNDIDIKTDLDLTLDDSANGTGFDNAVGLKDGQSFVITGIPSTVKYIITEQDPGNYYKVQNMVNGTWTKESFTFSDDTASDLDTVKTTMDKKNNTVDFENYRGVSNVPATGIILNFAPYILLVAFAGVFAVLFLRKRREEF